MVWEIDDLGIGELGIIVKREVGIGVGSAMTRRTHVMGVRIGKGNN